MYLIRIPGPYPSGVSASEGDVVGDSCARDLDACINGGLKKKIAKIVKNKKVKYPRRLHAPPSPPHLLATRGRANLYTHQFLSLDLRLPLLS